MKKASYLSLVFIFFTIITNGADIRQTEAILAKSVAVEAEAQSVLEEWAADRSDLMFEIRQANIKSVWLEYQITKYTNYIAKQKDIIQQLKRKKEKARSIRMELEPLLEQMRIHLETVIREDLPFLPEERRRRLDFLKNSLSDYHVTLSEKLRRTLEVLKVEAEYGNSLENTEIDLGIKGISTRVAILRIGRTMMFYRSPDGKQVGRWDSDKNAWESLSADYTGQIEKAFKIISRKSAVELLQIPVNGLKR